MASIWHDSRLTHWPMNIEHNKNLGKVHEKSIMNSLEISLKVPNFLNDEFSLSGNPVGLLNCNQNEKILPYLP